MKIIFVSFDEEGWLCLNKMLELKVKEGNKEGNIVGIFTLEDERRITMAGNKPFDDLAEKYNVPLFKIKNINDESTLQIIRDLDPDISFVIGWSQLVKAKFLHLSKNKCIGIHPTLLPRHRGRAPLPWAIIFGLKKTGVTMFYINEGTDSGDIIGQVEVPITSNDDATSLYQKVLRAHEELVEKFFPLIITGKAPRIPQDERRASNWPKRISQDGIIDWNTCARNIYDWIRALTDPYPGAFTFLNDNKLFIWKSRLVDGSGQKDNINDIHGKIVDIDEEGLVITTGEGLLKLTVIQMENQSRLEGKEILNSGYFSKGLCLE